MYSTRFLLMAVFSAMAFASCSSGPDAKMLCDGVPLELAEWRSRVLSDVRYDLHFRITSDSDTEIKACESVSFTLTEKADAVYLGVGEFNARQSAKNFTLETLGEALKYCHIYYHAKYNKDGHTDGTFQFLGL